MAIKIAIFASGAGSNTQRIIDYFKGNSNVQVRLIVCNNAEAGVLRIALNERITSLLIERSRFFKEASYLPILTEYGIDWIILAGFLWKIPEKMIEAYPHRIINIHPALLPKYGGKGMYGHHVHQAVLDAGDHESGITIHFVDEQYDHGLTIFQAKCPVANDDTPDSLAQKVHILEHKYFPQIIEQVILKKNKR
ncbi:MAG: phosphoribosylglycinamide formyltransferase [Sphingobacteriales bacterium]|jgi:phosphoribosylglycinamide formyltransferase-1|nr:phosphoribosylglycinamide formyltransferase [Sphingobacteriales bacterium]